MSDSGLPSYRLPPDIRGYKVRYKMGLSFEDIAVACGAFMAGFMLPQFLGLPTGMGLLIGFIAGGMCAGTALLFVFKPEDMGGYSVPGFILARFIHSMDQHPVQIPLITAFEEPLQARLQTMDGVTLATIGAGDEESGN